MACRRPHLVGGRANKLGALRFFGPFFGDVTKNRHGGVRPQLASIQRRYTERQRQCFIWLLMGGPRHCRGHAFAELQPKRMCGVGVRLAQRYQFKGQPNTSDSSSTSVGQ